MNSAKRLNLFAASIIPALMAYTITHASEQEYFAETDFFGEAPVVLTVSRMYKPLEESPASVTVIDRQMILDSGATAVADIFRMIPGFFISHNARNGNAPMVYYQGLGEEFYRQFQVLIDGRSVFIPSFGGVPWRNLPLLLQDIERVEVTRGPNSVTYGANAFLATINIITRHATEDSGEFITLLKDITSSTQTSNLYFRSGNQVNNLDWRITAGREENDGLDGQHDSSLSEKLNIRTDILTANNHFWTIQAGINKTKNDLGDGEVNNIFRDKLTTNSYQNIRFEISDSDLTSVLKLNHTRQRVEDQFDTPQLNSFFGIPSPPVITGDVKFNRLSDRMDFEGYQNRTLSDSVTINYGLNLRRDKVKSFYLFHDSNDHEIDYRRIFGSLEWKSDSGFILDLGAMSDENDYTDRELSSRISLIQKIKDHHLRLVSSTATRNPVLFELEGFAQFDIPDITHSIPGIPSPFTLMIPVLIGAPDLQAEKIVSHEIGLFSQFLQKQLTTDIKIFSYNIDDRVKITQTDIVSNDPTRIYLNSDSSTPLSLTGDFDTWENSVELDVSGIELSFNFSPSHKGFRLYGGYSTTRVSSNHKRSKTSFPDKVGFIGGHINIGVRHQLSALMNRVYKYRLMDNFDNTEEFTRIDIRYQIMIDPKKETKFEVIGQNIHESYDDYGDDLKQEKAYFIRFSTAL